TNELGTLYRIDYTEALSDAGLAAVDLIERFPVLTGHFGYTRGEFEPGKGRLVPYKGKHGQGYKVYADLAETEALFVRLDAVKVAEWLERRGNQLPRWDSDQSAREAILQVANIPADSDQQPRNAGSDLLCLVHSYAHRFMRMAAVHGGIDRNALSELLVPLH